MTYRVITWSILVGAPSLPQSLPKAGHSSGSILSIIIHSAPRGISVTYIMGFGGGSVLLNYFSGTNPQG